MPLFSISAILLVLSFFYGLPFGICCLVWTLFKRRGDKSVAARAFAAASWAATRATIGMLALLAMGWAVSSAFWMFCALVFPACPISLAVFRWTKGRESVVLTAKDVEPSFLYGMLAKYLAALLAAPSAYMLLNYALLVT